MKECAFPLLYATDSQSRLLISEVYTVSLFSFALGLSFSLIVYFIIYFLFFIIILYYITLYYIILYLLYYICKPPSLDWWKWSGRIMQLEWCGRAAMAAVSFVPRQQ